MTLSSSSSRFCSFGGSWHGAVELDALAVVGSPAPTPALVDELFGTRELFHHLILLVEANPRRFVDCIRILSSTPRGRTSLPWTQDAIRRAVDELARLGTPPIPHLVTLR